MFDLLVTSIYPAKPRALILIPAKLSVFLFINTIHLFVNKILYGCLGILSFFGFPIPNLSDNSK